MGKMPMGPHAKCSECNSALPSDAPEWLCPQCLIKAVLDNHSDVASPSPTDPPRFMERNELPDSRPSNSSSGDSIPGYEVIREIHRKPSRRRRSGALRSRSCGKALFRGRRNDHASSGKCGSSRRFAIRISYRCMIAARRPAVSISPWITSRATRLIVMCSSTTPR